VGGDIDDPRVIELVGELTIASPCFPRMWGRHDVSARAGAAVTLRHPQVGEIHLDREKLSVSGTDGIMLVIYHPRPGTDSADRLALLASAATVPSSRPGAVAEARRSVMNGL
jgi:MmyB-like transcription regulator ligand binding domain